MCWRCAQFFCYCLLWLDVCIWCMFVSMSVVVTVWGSVGMFVKNSVF